MNDTLKFDWDDITIVPEVQTNIESRQHVHPYFGTRLPLITAPMVGVVDENNYLNFVKNDCLVTIPRNVNIPPEDFVNYPFYFETCVFISFGLCDFEGDNFKKTELYILENGIYNICIDIANGHMKKLENTIRKIKDSLPDVKIMTGNIANPNTFKCLSDAGADFIRVGIGGGGACLTSQQSSIHYPMASLVQDVYTIKKKHKLSARIVADGGMKKYSDIIKALALGADLVMVGSIFNRTVEASAKTRLWKKLPIPRILHNWLFKHGFPLYHLFFGMSTKLAQTLWGNRQMKTSEGTVSYQRVEYTLKQWTENFEDYLRSAMSYTNSENLEEFKGASFVRITQNALNRFKK